MMNIGSGIRPLGVLDLLQTLAECTPSQISNETPDELLDMMVPELMPQIVGAATHDRDKLVWERFCGLLRRRVVALARSSMATKRLRIEVIELREAVEREVQDWPEGLAILNNTLVWRY